MGENTHHNVRSARVIFAFFDKNELNLYMSLLPIRNQRYIGETWYLFSIATDRKNNAVHDGSKLYYKTPDTMHTRGNLGFPIMLYHVAAG